MDAHDPDKCLDRFRTSLAIKDRIAQIFFSYTYYLLKNPEQLQPYPLNYKALSFTCDEAYPALNKEGKLAYIKKVYQEAVGLKFLPAVLEFLCAEWKSHNHFGFAVQLKPYVNQGEPFIDLFFGKALVAGSLKGTDRYYEGLYWIHNTVGLNNYTTSAEEKNALMEGSGEVTWESFLQNKVRAANIADQSFYKVIHDPKNLGMGIRPHNLRFESYQEGNLIGVRTYNQLGLLLDWVAVDRSTLKVKYTHIPRMFAEYNDFIAQVLMKTGKGESAVLWLEQMAAKEEPSDYMIT